MIYLHIGPHKTGTSTLQAWLAAHRALLLSAGYCYPGTEENHHVLGRQAIVAARKGLIPPSLVAYLRETDRAPNGIISTEHLDALDEGTVKAIRGWFGARDVTIVIYARAPWDRSASMLGEHLKRLNRTRWGRDWNDIADDALPGLAGRSSLPSMLGTWSKVFGKPSIKLRVLDRARLVGGDLIADFIDAIGAADTPALMAHRSISVQNEMPGIDQLRILRCASEIVAPGDKPPRELRRADKQVNKHIGGLLLRASKSLAIDQGRASLLSASEVRRYQAAAAAPHQAIARQWLGLGDEALFSEPDWTRLPAESFDWNIRQVPHAALEQLVIESTIAALDPGSPLAREALRKLAPLNDQRRIPAGAAAWMSMVRCSAIEDRLALQADAVFAACLCIGLAWPRIMGGANAGSSGVQGTAIADIIAAWRADSSSRSDAAIQRVGGTPDKPGPRKLIALAIQSILAARRRLRQLDAHWRRVYSSARSPTAHREAETAKAHRG